MTGEQPDQDGERIEGVAELRRQYLVAVDAVQLASERTIDALVASRAARDVARANASSGRPMVELEHVLQPQALRASLSDALADLERTRHDAQRFLFRLMHAEGQTLADIGRMWGISRQLVSRMVNEPDPEPRG